MRTDYYMPLTVSLTPVEIRHHYNEKENLPAHDLVIRPLLENCIEAFVYGIKKDNELFKLNSEILISEKGKFKFDKNKECIKGHEYLWNATTWKRGSIVIIIDKDNFNKQLFKYCYGPGICETPNSGNSLSAIKKCKEESEKGNIGILFSASNGIEWIQIYCTQELKDNLLKNAQELCQENDRYHSSI